jgi:hypothetical protein
MDAPGQLDNRMNFLIRRPQVADAPPYYFTYINQAAGDNPLLALEDQLEEALALFLDDLRRQIPLPLLA